MSDLAAAHEAARKTYAEVSSYAVYNLALNHAIGAFLSVLGIDPTDLENIERRWWCAERAIYVERVEGQNPCYRPKNAPEIHADCEWRRHISVAVKGDADDT